jgi:epoxide hydrolase-like predicted phosphatase
MYKAIIFDFFDVIRTDIYRSWLNLHGYDKKGNFLDVKQELNLDEINFDEFLHKLSDINNQTAESISEEMQNGAKVDHDVVELIKKLRKNYRVILLSNSPSGLLRGLLQEDDLEKYFDEIIISSEVGLIKPNAEIFQLTLKRVELRPEECIFIDDSEKNTAASEAVGIKAILYTNSSSLKTSLKKLGISY